MTEESIDTERMMLGIDDADNHSINWIRCADRMPPCDEYKNIIVRNWRPTMVILTGAQVNEQLDYSEPCYAEWIPYDEATWRDLNDNS